MSPTSGCPWILVGRRARRSLPWRAPAPASSARGAGSAWRGSGRQPGTMCADRACAAGDRDEPRDPGARAPADAGRPGGLVRRLRTRDRIHCGVVTGGVLHRVSAWRAAARRNATGDAQSGRAGPLLVVLGARLVAGQAVSETLVTSRVSARIPMSDAQHQLLAEAMIEECERLARRAEWGGRGRWAAFWLGRVTWWRWRWAHGRRRL